MHTSVKQMLEAANAAIRGRSALSGKALKDLGYTRVYNLGAFKDWVQADGAVDQPG